MNNKKNYHMKIKLIVTFILLFYSSIVLGQNPLDLNSSDKEEIVKKVASIMHEKYVFVDVGKKMAKHILQLYGQGEYVQFNEVKPFCRRLTSDLRKISNDKHIFVFYSPEEAVDVAARNNQLLVEEIEEINKYYEKIEQRENYGFKKVEILKGNIGYFEIEYISGDPKACEKVDNILGFLCNTNAIIIDLRNNGGGGGSGADDLLMSYFFGEEKVLLSGVYDRESDKIQQTWSLENVSGKRLPNIDLYILTSSKTFSAAENISYSLQALNRAVIVGEKTKGGAHPIDVIQVKGDILTQVSIGNSINPITGTNWEGVGVKPDIDVSSEDALSKAHILAINKIINKTNDPEYKEELMKIIKILSEEKSE